MAGSEFLPAALGYCPILRNFPIVLDAEKPSKHPPPYPDTMKLLRNCLPFALLAALLLLAAGAQAQITIRGVVQDAQTGETLIGASILIQGTASGSISDVDGSFALRVPELPVVLSVSYVGYATVLVEVADGQQEVSIALARQQEADDLLAVGTRFVARSAASSPVPIDNITHEELLATGQPTLAQALMYAVPAFNTSQQAVSDATAHFDPTDLRALGPSRMLVLVNGKRRHASALAYINDTPGKSEAGIDWASIPLSAVERVEVLRDGASAQYGSDAIAGVVNIVLKDAYSGSGLRLFAGGTAQGDGMQLGYDLHAGVKLGGKGGLMVSNSFRNQRETNRAGTPGQDGLFGVGPEDPWIQANPGLGMRIGQPDMTVANLSFSAKAELDGSHQVYGFGGLASRQGKSYALYRTPYWRQDPFNLLHPPGTEYQGFLPTLETDIIDQYLVLGTKGKQQEWSYDVSIDWGSNRVGYTVGNSLNPSLGAESPTRFDAGGHRFSHLVTNADVGRAFGSFHLAAGTEFRREQFEIVEGEPASYLGAGAQSFPGLQPSNASTVHRFNVGAYLEGNWQPLRWLLLDAAARYERYSDFGDNFTWKLNARGTLNANLFVRASVSTGFRAPSLHQIYQSNVQSIVSGGTISNQGTFNNLSPVVSALQVPRLKEENSFNLSAGFGLALGERFSLTADYYRIAIDDRVVFTSSIASDDTTQLVGQILQAYSVTSIKFFTNAASTLSQGLDLVATLQGLAWAGGTLLASVSANFNHNAIQGRIATPAPLSAAGVDLFDRKEQARMLWSRPAHKVMLRLLYQRPKWSLQCSNTHFGQVVWQHAEDPARDQTFRGKLITDLQAHYQLLPKLGLRLSVNNLLNVYPDAIDTKGDVVTDLGGRFRYPWEVNQFGFAGTTVMGSVQVRF
jgi:iron complex outermembrane receptor protein